MKLNKLISYIFHPILVPIIGTLLYFILQPRHTSKQLEITIIASVFIGTYILPLLFLTVLKRTKVIQNFHLEVTEERKFPLLFFISISYFLSTLIKKGVTTIDLALFFYGMTIALIIAYFLLYLKFKVSLHMIGVSGLIGFFTFFSFLYQINTLLILVLLFIFSGLIASSRLALKAHHKKEVYFGFLLGFLSQIGVYLIYNM